MDKRRINPYNGILFGSLKRLVFKSPKDIEEPPKHAVIKEQ